MINAVYCRNCRKPLDPADTFCRYCGADQRPPSQQPVPSQPPPAPLFQPAYVPQQNTSSVVVLEEYARQYKGLTWLQFIGLFLIPFYLLGLALIIYALVQKPAFRRKVVELGYDPEAWERPLRAHARVIMYTGFAVCAVIILSLRMWLKFR